MKDKGLKVVKCCRSLSKFVRFCSEDACKIRAMALAVGGLAFVFSSMACAKAPVLGDPPQKGRKTGYWAQVNKVVDGDTVYVGGVKVRLVGIDTPETSSDRRHGYKCEAERRLGELATIQAEAILLHRKVWVKPSGAWDRYDRPLVKIRYSAGKWYGEEMIRAKLAAPWLGRKHKWCEELTY